MSYELTVDNLLMALGHIERINKNGYLDLYSEQDVSTEGRELSRVGFLESRK